MKSLISEPSGFTGQALAHASLTGMLVNVLGTTVMAQSHPAKVPDKSTIAKLWAMMAETIKPLEHNDLIRITTATPREENPKGVRALLRDLARSLFAAPTHQDDMAGWWLDSLQEKNELGFDTNKYVWGPLWQAPRRTLNVQVPYTKDTVKGEVHRPYWSMKCESPCSPASMTIAYWCLLRDAAALGVHLVPKQAAKVNGMDMKMKQLEDAVFDADQADLVGG